MSARVQIIQVPYDSGNRDIRMGSGPGHFVRHGLAEVLRAAGHAVRVETIEANTEFRAEVQTQFALYGSLAGRISEARRDGKFPLILSGNCGATLGAIAGAGAKRLGVVWFDAHGDFNTPETTTSGFLDGMALAVAAGLCWTKFAAMIPNFKPLPGVHILHVGGRDFDGEESNRFEQAGSMLVTAAAIERTGVREALQPALSQFRRGVEEVHLHLDLDVLNPKEAPANEYVTEEGGLSVEEVLKAIRLIKEKENVKMTSATIAAFDPRYDPQGKTVAVGFTLMKEILSGE